MEDKNKKKTTTRKVTKKIETAKPIKKTTKETIKETKPKKIEKTIQKEKVEKRNASFNLLEVIVIIIITSLIVGVSSSLIVYKNYDKIEKEYNETETSDLDEFINAYNSILNSYVDEVDSKGLIDAAIKAMYNKLGDPHTSYLDKTTTEELQERLNGEYEGLGIEITKNSENGYILITNVFKDTPAEKAGLKIGDLITHVNGESVEEKTTSEVSTSIKGNKSANIKIDYIRNEESYTVNIETSHVVIPSITKENFDGIGYIKISTFSNTTYSQFEEALEELERDNIKGLVIDVRDNTGGYLNSATEIVELFTEKGKVIYQLESKGEITKVYKDETRESRDLKISILTNNASASASEILAAALKESYGAQIVGEITYGKGTVQETSTLESGEMLKYTTAYWLTPNGNKIDKIGLVPDIIIQPNEYETYSYEVDNQLQRAIEAVK